jgi:glycopeptide antibiotics resistance protein
MGFDRQFVFIIGIPILIIMEVIRYKKARRSKTKFLNHRETLIIVLFIYVMGLISVTLLPFYSHVSIKPTANLIPVFNTIKDISTIPVTMKTFMIKFWIINIFGNLILLAPLAAIAPMIFKKFRNFKATAILCLLVSVSIEFLQYLSMFCGNYRSVDIDDIILNTLGSMIGFGIYKLYINIISKSKYKFQSICKEESYEN